MILPLWQFGKSRVKDGGSRSSYAVLAAAPEFAGRCLAILRRISENAAWRPKGKDVCSPVTACWPLDADNWLLLRFLDDGMDDHHRPNTMRIEAVLAEGRSWEELYSLLPPEAWPAPAPDGATSIDLTPGEQQGEKPPKPTEPVLYMDTGELMTTLFTPIRSRTLDSKQDMGASPFPQTSQPVRKTTGTSPQLNHQDKKSPWRWMPALLLLAWLGSIMIIWMYAKEIERLQNEDKRSKEKIESLNIAKQGLEKQYREYKEESQREISELRAEAERSKKDAIEALPDELSSHYDTLRANFGAMKKRFDSLSDSLSGVEKDLEKFKDILRNAATSGQKVKDQAQAP